jgi:hypothetical protein
MCSVAKGWTGPIVTVHGCFQGEQPGAVQDRRKEDRSVCHGVLGRDGDVRAASRELVEVLAESGFRQVASLVSVDEDAAKVIVALSASDTQKLMALIRRGRQDDQKVGHAVT